MAVKQIIEVKDGVVPEVLSTKCKSVGEINDKIRQIVTDLLDTAHSQRDPGAAGLSANQIGETVRVCLVRRFIGQGASKDYILINPRITSASSATDIDWEACLSVPDVYGRVKRAKKLTVLAKNEAGQDIKLKATDFFARVIQHELDHLDGILFTSKLVGEPKSEKEFDRILTGVSGNI